MLNFKLEAEYVLGRNAIERLSTFFKEKEVKKVTLIYGGGSIKKNGLYDSLKKIVSNMKIELQEIHGIQPNPLDTSIWNAAIELRKFNSDYVIAAGGGSVIDAAKVISILANNPHFTSVEDYFQNSKTISKPSVPLISILTLSGTGSENNAGSVVTFVENQNKKFVATPSANPVLAIEDPVYTFTVNKWQTASGAFDCFSHILETYYYEGIFDWTKEYLFANLRVLLRHAETAYNDPENYFARENLMFTSSMSINNLASLGSDGDWNVHYIEHALSGKWDITHGAGLALITPTYIKYRSEKDEWFKQKTLTLGKEVMNVDSVDGVVDFINDWINKLNLPTAYFDFEEIKDVSDQDIEWLIDHIIKDNGNLERNDYKNILKLIPLKKQ